MNLNFNTESNSWRIDSKTGFLVVTACIIKSGVYNYEEYGNLYLSPSDVGKSLDNIAKMQITLDHHDVDIYNQKEYSKGYILADTLKVAETKSEQGETVVAIWGDLFITDLDLVKNIIKETPTNQTLLLSAGYQCMILESNGIAYGQEYEGIQTDLKYNHLAIIDKDLINEGVENRMGEDIRIYNAKNKGVIMQDDEKLENSEVDKKTDEKLENSEVDKKTDEKLENSEVDKKTDETKKLQETNAMLKNQLDDANKKIDEMNSANEKYSKMMNDLQKRLTDIENAAKKVEVQNAKAKKQRDYSDAVTLLNSYNLKLEMQDETSPKLQAINCIRKSENKQPLVTDDNSSIETLFNDYVTAYQEKQGLRSYNISNYKIADVNNSRTTARMTNAELNNIASKTVAELHEKIYKNTKERNT